MMRLIGSYGGGSYDESLVEVSNEFVEVEYPDVGSPTSVEEFRDTWFNASWFKPEDFCLVVENERVLGYGYMWLSSDMFRAMLRLRPSLTKSYQLMVVEKIIEWFRKKVVREGYTGLTRLRLGYEYRFLHNLLRELIEPITVDYTATFMKLDINKYRGLASKTNYGDLEIIRGGLEHVKDIVEIYNDAFSQYPWFIPWELEDAKRFYRDRLDKMIVFLAYKSGEPIGYCDGEIYTSISGARVGYVYTLAVKRKYQGKGVGTKLLYKLIDEMIRGGYTNIYLDAVDGLEKYYMRRGFQIVTRSLSYIIIL